MTFVRNKSIMLKIVLLCGMLLMAGIGNVYGSHGHGHDAKSPQGDHQCLSYKHSFMKTHINMYYELLAEKYAPDQVKVWQDIVKERKMLKKKLKNAEENGALLNGESIARNWYKEHHELQEKFAEAVKERKDKAIQKLLPEIFLHHQKLNDLYKESLKKMGQ